MAYNKKDHFDSELGEIARLARALGHPARLAILQALAEHESCVCGELVDLLPLAQSTVSQHLKELKDSGLIKGEIEGPRTCYCLDRKGLERLIRAMTAYLHDIESPADPVTSQRCG
jgi:DNA-binding transcriptional ArsR family regulator